MAKVFEMTRRARKPSKCDDCGDTIEVGKHWYFRRVKRKYGIVVRKNSPEKTRRGNL